MMREPHAFHRNSPSGQADPIGSLQLGLDIRLELGTMAEYARLTPGFASVDCLLRRELNEHPVGGSAG